MDDARSQDTLVLELRYPLRRMFQSCAAYCEPACCGLDSFDVNAYTLLWWIRQTDDEDVSHAMKLLSSLVVKVAAHCGPVASPDDLGHEWDSGEECAAYLSTWHAALEQAAFFARHGEPSASQRLAEARASGHRAYYLEVRRLCGEAGAFFNVGQTARATELYHLIADLDATDKAISSEVKYSRKMAAKMSGRPTGG